VAKLFADSQGPHGPILFTLKIMASQRKPKASPIKVEAPKVEAPKVEAPKVEVKVEAPKAEAPKVEEVKIDSNPVKVEEPRATLEKYERPETNQHEGESKWVAPDHGITQHLYGMGRLKHRMRTRKSRYEQ